MPVVRVEELSPDEAEEIVAFTWQVLEANAIDTPHLITRNHGGVELVLSFESQEAADLVMRKLQRRAIGRTHHGSGRITGPWLEVGSDQ